MGALHREASWPLAGRLSMSFSAPSNTFPLPMICLVLPLDKVENSTSPCERLSGWMFVIGQTRQATSSRSEAPSEFFCWHIHQSPRDMALHRHLASVALKRKLAAMGKRAPRAPSIVGWFCRLPSLAYVVGSVVPEGCHLVLEAA